ncbi:MAG: hypothetical protein WDZ44_00150 [Candidatus Spechtbacterales bacterium]
MLIGHEKHIATLEAMRKQDAMAHAFLVTGPSGVGKSEFALVASRWLQGGGEFASYSNATSSASNPDIIQMRSPSIKEIRQLRATVAQAPYSASTRAVILTDAHELGDEAANALLKTLEEPRSRTVFFLLAHNASRVLPTIASRCYHIPLGLVKDSQNLPEDVAVLVRGRPQRSLEFSQNAVLADQARDAVRDARKFLAGTLSERFTLIDQYSQEDAPFSLFFEALIEVTRGELGVRKGNTSLRALLDISRRLQTGNASSVWMLRSFALQTLSSKV